MSTLCITHCLLCGLAPGLFTALGLGALLGHEAEWGFTLVAVAIALVALTLGWRRHRSTPVAALISVGVVGLLLARVLEGGEQGEYLGVLSGLALVGGHLLSLRAARCCEEHSPCDFAG